jgi:hypothetical protein
MPATSKDVDPVEPEVQAETEAEVEDPFLHFGGLSEYEDKTQHRAPDIGQL